MSSNYVMPLESLFRSRANTVKAGPMKAYMKDKFSFLGIQSTERRELQRKFLKDYGLPEQKALEPVIRELWQLPEREFQYAALDILERILASEACTRFSQNFWGCSSIWW